MTFSLFLVAFREFTQQGAAACIDIVVGDVEVAGVPRVGDVALLAEIGEEAADFVVGIAARETVEVAHVLCVHADDAVIGVVVGGSHECRAPLRERDAVRTQDFARAAMCVAAELVAVEGFGCDADLIGKSRLAYELFHDELCHG